MSKCSVVQCKCLKYLVLYVTLFEHSFSPHPPPNMLGASENKSSPGLAQPQTLRCSIHNCTSISLLQSLLFSSDILILTPPWDLSLLKTGPWAPFFCTSLKTILFTVPMELMRHHIHHRVVSFSQLVVWPLWASVSTHVKAGWQHSYLAALWGILKMTLWAAHLTQSLTHGKCSWAVVVVH